MTNENSFPQIEDLFAQIGEVGQRLAEMGACEGAAGNISVCMRWSIEPRVHFPLVETVLLPLAVPELVGAAFLVSGSGRRLREILQEPEANLGCLVVEADGCSGKLYTATRRRFTRLTSEFNSHLAVHHDQVRLSGTNFHAIVHAQPSHLTFLSHVPAYQEETYLNQHLLRWQPESIMQFPEGVGHIGFQVPGSPE